jgi:hypothetical protein
MKRTFVVGINEKHQAHLIFNKNEETDQWVCELDDEMMEEIFEMIENKTRYQ